MGKWKGALATLVNPDNVPQAAFWRGRRVFLTGHTGFKGAWLSLWLHRLGASVVGFSKDIPTEPSLHKAFRLPELLTDLRGDINDLRPFPPRWIPPSRTLCYIWRRSRWCVYPTPSRWRPSPPT